MRIMPKYSGKRSEKFWAMINSHKGIKHELLYAMGCCLQNLESTVLREVNSASVYAKSYKVKE